MRSAPTASEAALFRLIGGGQLGVVFRRQVVLGNRFVVDFFAPSLRLVVEVDGGYHAERRRADARRDEKLGRLGYRVLRVDAALVMRGPLAAVALVRAAVESLL
jgi:very-short-patch-repair endonuclease